MVWNCLASLNFKVTNICDWLKEKLKKENFDVL